MEEYGMGDNYRHFNSLIWQVPSWGIAIATAGVVAADKIGSTTSTWLIPSQYVQAAVLGFGAFLLISLTIALYKYRIFQAACLRGKVPSPPFGKLPKANRYLQAAMCLTTGAMAGLAVSQALSKLWPLLAGLMLGFIAWITSEIGNAKIVGELRKQREAE